MIHTLLDGHNKSYYESSLHYECFTIFIKHSIDLISWSSSCSNSFNHYSPRFFSVAFLQDCRGVDNQEDPAEECR